MLKVRSPTDLLLPFYEELVSHGARLSPEGSILFGFRTDKGGRFVLPGISSQFVSGLLMVAPLWSKILKYW